MNGRIYDSTLGRFMQADRIIQAPNDSQSKLWKKVKPFIGAIIGVIVSIYCSVCGTTIINAALTGAAIGD